MTDGTNAAQATNTTDTSAQSTAAAALPTSDAAAATQQKPAEGDKPASTDATATAPKEGDKPATKPEGELTDAQKTEKATADKAAADKVTADAEAAKKAGEAPKGAPEKYDAFALPDGVKLSTDAEAKLTTVAKELNLPQEGAQKLITLAADVQKSMGQAMDAKITEVRNQWEADSKADKEFGGDNFAVNLAIANTAVAAFGSPAFNKLLKDSGMSQHPEFIRTFLNIGRSISQDTIVSGGNSAATEAATGLAAAASKLYGKS